MDDQLYTVDQYRQRLRPLLDNEHVRCALCGKSYRRITHSHLETHAEFLVKHRGPKWVRTPADSLDDIRKLGHDPQPFQQRAENLSEI